MSNWYKKVLAYRGSRAFDLDDAVDRNRDPYETTDLVDPAGYHTLGGNERTGYPQNTQEVKDKEDPYNLKNIEDMEETMFLNNESIIGEGSGTNKQEPFTDPIDKLNRMNEVPDPTGPHNMRNPIPNAPNRLTDRDVYDLVSRRIPLSRVRNI